MKTQAFIPKISVLILWFLCWMLTIPVVCIAQKAKLVLPIGHTASVMEVWFTPDEKKVLTRALDFTAKLWETETGILLADFEENKESVYATAMSKDGMQVLTAANDSIIRLWDLKNGSVFKKIKRPGALFRSAKYAPNGKSILSIANGYKLDLWDATTGDLIKTFETGNKAIRFADFLADGKKIIMHTKYSVQILDISTGIVLQTIYGQFYKAYFSNDGKKILTTTEDGPYSFTQTFTAKLWDAETGEIITTIKSLVHSVNNCAFSDNSEKIITACSDSTFKIFSTKTGKLLTVLHDKSGYHHSAKFYNNDSQIITANFGSDNLIIWDSASGERQGTITGLDDPSHFFISNKEHKLLITFTYDNSCGIWDMPAKKHLTDLKSHANDIRYSYISPDGKNLTFSITQKGTKRMNIKTGKLNADLPAYRPNILFSAFSDNRDELFTVNGKSHKGLWLKPVSEIWDVNTNTLKITLKGEIQCLKAYLYPQINRLITYGLSKIEAWDTKTGEKVYNISNEKQLIHDIQISPDEKKIVACFSDSTVRVFQLTTGQVLLNFKPKSYDIRTAVFSPDGKSILGVSIGSPAQLFDAVTGALKDTIGIKSDGIVTASYSPDGMRIVTGTYHRTVKIWDVKTKKVVTELIGHDNTIWSATFTPDGKNIVTSSDDNTIKVWDAHTGSALYTFIAVGETDYLVIDIYGRYDGTENARKMLYFTCGLEVIGLDQVKDQLWVPNLAERIMEGNIINAPKLTDLELCGLTPLIEQLTVQNGYRFKVIPRHGGLGETVLYLNGIELRRYQLEQLSKTQGGYELAVKESELAPYLKSGQSNDITIIGYTAKNDISSRGMRIIQKGKVANSTPPNLYAVIVGVSDYKGTELDLRYAAKDAVDISTTLGVSARKLLNTDGKEHVFIYNLNTEKNTTLPEKLSIKNAFSEVGKKATANDIFLVFFSGHGVMQGESKKFYFLTADASISSSPEVVGISTDELSDWMKPANIKAQKRILIFDACNSGQAVNEMITIGKTDQNYFAARNDDKSQQIKTIEKLNEKSGLFILSASASNQSAYELGKYAQGVLTYSLLKTIKEQPDILEDNQYLNVGKWFTAAEKTVTDLVRENGNQQQPQLVSTTSFNIGVVDKDLIANIKLPQAKALFTSSNFQNADESIADDDLEFNKALNTELNTISAKGGAANISYVSGSNSPDAWSLSGRYKVSGDSITVRVNVKQYRQPPKHTFEVSGKITQLNILVADVVKKVTELTAGNGK